MASDGETPAGLTRKSSRNQLEDALEVDVNDLQTLGTFIINTAKDEDTSDLSILIQSIGTSCKYIANCVRKLGLAKLAGKAGTENVQGEEQMKLDLVAHEVFSRGLDRSGRCTVMVSEEVEETISCATSPHGRYVCVYDPLDGSSNIDCSVSIGSIFGIYKRRRGACATTRTLFSPERTWSPLATRCTAPRATWCSRSAGACTGSRWTRRSGSLS